MSTAEYSYDFGAVTQTQGAPPAGGKLLTIQQSNHLYWVHEDSVTKSKRMTDVYGNVMSTIELDPWGADTNRSSNSAFLPQSFASYIRDANGGQDAMARRYSVGGTFAQPDPYGGSYDFSEPQSLNRYAYVGGDPVNLRDPSGLNLEWQEPWRASQGIGANSFWSPGIHLRTSPYRDVLSRVLVIFDPLTQSPQNPTPTRLQSAIDLARTTLSRESCRKLFAGFIDPVKLLDDLASGNKGIGSIRQGSLLPTSNNAETTGILGSRTVTNAQGQQVRQSAFTGANITINSNLAAAFQAGYGGRFGVSDEINRAITLIHELGHAADIIYGQYSSGIMNDEGGGIGKIASDMNSERVFKECFEMDPSTYGGGQ